MSADASPGEAPAAGPEVLAVAAVAIVAAVANEVSEPLPQAPSQPHEVPAREAEPGWQHSSLELLTGVEVTDFSESITGETFDALFRP